MAQNIPYVAFSGGEVGQEVLARTNIETYGATAAIMENCLPEVGGPKHFRPGTKFCASLDGTKRTRGIDFTFDTQTYGILLSDSEVRIEQNGGVIVRFAVTASITDGVFSIYLTNWTSVTTGAGSAAGGSTGLVMSSNGSDKAGVKQAVTINEVGTVHGLRIVVASGPVTLRLGSTDGGEEYLRTTLRAGTHSLGVTPTGALLSIEITSTDEAQRTVTSVAFEAAGDLVLPTPWTESQLQSLRHDQLNDVVTFTSGVGRPKRLERRASASWSITDTAEDDGPWLDPNVDESYTLTPSVRSGNGTLTANRDLFKSGHLSALFKLTHSGQFVSRVLSGAEQYTEFVKVQGAGSSRTFSYTITGTFTATLTLQRSIGNTSSWTDVTTFTTTASSTYTDGTTFDNQTVYYRFGIKTGNYTSGSATAAVTYTGGSTDGVCRITSVDSTTVCQMEVMNQFGAVTATTEWQEGAWSSQQTWPKAIGYYDGRLWTGGYYARIYGSVSDAYESHDNSDPSAADSAINRVLSIGKARRIMALMPLARLLILTANESADVEPVRIEGGAPVVKSTAFDEPLTSTNLTIRDTMAARGVFVDRDEHQAIEVYYSVEAQDYQMRSLMRLNKNLGRPGITEMATSRRPDRRLWFVRSDGVLLAKLYDPAENTLGWSRIITDGEIESVYVKPASSEDEVMVIVKRTVNGQTVRYLEQFDPIYLATAAAANRVDAYVRKEDAAGFTVITGLDHLEGRTVKVWANGASHPDRVVSGGQITLAYSVTSAVAGIGYEGRYQSSKLLLQAKAGTALGQMTDATTIQFVLNNTTRAIEYGGDFDLMDQLHDRDLGTLLDNGSGLFTGTTEPVNVPSDPSRDARVCLRMKSPHPVTINGYIVSADMHERTA